MPSPSPDPGIQSWFVELKQMQAACINNVIKHLPLLAFANTNILKALPSAAEQNNFITSFATASGYPPFQIADFTTYSTFKALLDYRHLLENEIFNTLQARSAPPLNNADSIPYYAALVATAFPGGSIGSPWADPQNGVQALLMVSMDSTCYTLPFRIQVNATVDKAGSTMGVLLPQIAVLG